MSAKTVQTPRVHDQVIMGSDVFGGLAKLVREAGIIANDTGRASGGFLDGEYTYGEIPCQEEAQPDQICISKMRINGQEVVEPQLWFSNFNLIIASGLDPADIYKRLNWREVWVDQTWTSPGSVKMTTHINGVVADTIEFELVRQIQRGAFGSFLAWLFPVNNSPEINKVVWAIKQAIKRSRMGL